MKATLKKIDQEFKAIAEAHLQVHSYFFGEFFEVYSQHQPEYCSLLVNVNNAIIQQKFVTLQIEILVTDKTFDGIENSIDVESDTLQILDDIVNIMNYSDRWQKFGIVDAQSTARKVVEKGGDTVNGWYLTMNFKIFKDEQGFCDLPLENYSYE